ncbi:MAG: hypothetical protein ACJARN_000672 [Arenicella sp.]|jgi:hypothetical protein
MTNIENPLDSLKEAISMETILVILGGYYGDKANETEKSGSNEPANA